MNSRRTLLTRAGVGLVGSWPFAASLAQMLDGDSIVLFRHATAPGLGDPPGFRLGDCSTQRNLDAAGRDQARRMGEALRARAGRNGAQVGAVWSSPWCRTLETAALAFPRVRVQSQDAFASFFSDRDSEPARTQRARDLLLSWSDAGLLVVVTHQVNITAMTGVVPASGEGVVLRRRGPELVESGRLPPP